MPLMLPHPPNHGLSGAFPCVHRHPSPWALPQGQEIHLAKLLFPLALIGCTCTQITMK